MYRHLLVVLQPGAASVLSVGQSVALARNLDARISFLLPQPDPGTSDSPHADEILAKAAAAAHALGVPCSSRSGAGRDAGEALQTIQDEARREGCDLIVLAGPELASPLVQAGLPVLVQATAGSGPAGRAIATLRDEHRAIAAVLHAWSRALDQAELSAAAIDPARMRAMLDFLRDFPLAQHHPREERHLFSRLRARTRELDAELEELRLQHVSDGQRLACIADALARWEQTAAGPARGRALADLSTAVRSYTDFLWAHMGREESVILPAAQSHLRPEDWEAIEAGWAADPAARSGSAQEREFHLRLGQILALPASAQP